MTAIELVEVSPRDGLQNEPRVLSVDDRVELIVRAVAIGVRRIEVASFVDPRRVPQMANAEAVVAALPRRADVRTIGLVLNERGARRALATGVDEVGLVCPATDRFGLANQGMTVEDGLASAERILALAAAAGRPAQATVAVAFGCPFAGGVEPARIVAVARRLAAAGAIEVALADTIGVARPDEVARLVAAVRRAIAPVPVRAHFHDTRGAGVTNAVAAVAAGARTIDAALGGTGGCPFAPGAAGNVATEAVVYALAPRLPGIDLPQTVAAAEWLVGKLGRRERSAVMRALGRDPAIAADRVTAPAGPPRAGA